MPTPRHAYASAIRIAADALASVTTGCAHESTLVDAVTEFASALALPMPRNLPHAIDARSLPDARCAIATAARRFAHRPSVTTWLGFDSALANLNAAWERLDNLAHKPRLLSPTVPGFERPPPRCYRAPVDAVRAMFGASARVAKASPSSEPSNFASDAIKNELRCAPYDSVRNQALNLAHATEFETRVHSARRDRAERMRRDLSCYKPAAYAKPTINADTLSIYSGR